MKTIILYGLRRSGNHFLISLILQQFSNYVHLNDICLSYDNYIKWKNINKTKERIDCGWTGFKDVECVVISLENKTIDKELDKFRKIENCNVLFLLRSPYCHFSSVWRVYNKNESKLLEIIKLWKIYAKHFIQNDEFIKVLYDELSTDDNYIVNLLKKLDIYNIKSIDKSKYIRFQKSSFGSNSAQQKQVYKTLENCVFKNDVNFIKLLKDKKEIDNLWDLVRKVYVQKGLQ
tara:strand:+ start:1575 stop:2270 length:696 start_codon:yes stop_codon:yes gene_type:complete